jgi:outer membrane protein assembly factor BamB
MMHGTRLIAFCVILLAVNGAHAQDWPQWRGTNRDNKVAGFAAPKEWPKELTKKWKVTVGIGEASPLLLGDRVYVFARQDADEVTLCLDAASGKEIWKDKYSATAVKGPSSKLFSGTRSTPAVGEGKVCTLGVNGTVSCLDAATGKLVWRKETKSKPKFYTSTSPIIADGKCIVYVGALSAYDLASGDSKWTWTGGGTPYGSPVLMTVDGTKQVVTPTMDNTLAGINLADGKLLWQVKSGGTDYFGNYSTPLINGQTVYYTAGVKKGIGPGSSTTAFKIEKKGDGFAAAELWKKGFAAANYHTPLLKDGLIFGVSTAKTFFCVDAKTGEELWKDKTPRGECGSILDVGPVLLSLTSDKQLVAFKASNKEYLEVAKYTVSDSPTWCVPIIAGNRIFVKDKAGSLTLWTIE